MKKERSPKRSVDDIRKCFGSSDSFNEIFEAFQHALAQRLDDIELYRQLFWNHTLSPDELALFGEKIAKEFPHIAYDSYMWLANVFEVTTGLDDNYDRALAYYKKAAAVRPKTPEPYLGAAECYDPVLNIPPLPYLIDFLKDGTQHVAPPTTLYQRLAHFYEISGNDEMSMYYRRMSGEGPAPPPPPSAPLPPDQPTAPPPRQ